MHGSWGADSEGVQRSFHCQAGGQRGAGKGPSPEEFWSQAAARGGEQGELPSRTGVGSPRLGFLRSLEDLKNWAGLGTPQSVPGSILRAGRFRQAKGAIGGEKEPPALTDAPRQALVVTPEVVAWTVCPSPAKGKAAEDLGEGDFWRQDRGPEPGAEAIWIRGDSSEEEEKGKEEEKEKEKKGRKRRRVKRLKPILRDEQHELGRTGVGPPNPQEGGEEAGGCHGGAPPTRGERSPSGRSAKGEGPRARSRKER